MREFKYALIVIICSVPLFGTALHADEPSDGSTLSEIVVTAEKRAERLHDVPIAASAFTQADIDRLALTGIESLSRAVPSLSFTSLGFEPSISIRGVSTNIGLEPAVSVYINDVPLDVRTDTFSGSTLIDLFDLDHIEILRGPQGTLFGASSMGGAIRLITAQPDPTHFSERYEVELSDTDKTNRSAINYVAKGAVNIPLSSSLAMRFAITYSADGGWINRSLATDFSSIMPGEPTTNRDENTLVSTGFRAAMRWTPDATWTITPSFIYQDKAVENAPAYYPDAGLFVRPHLITDQGSFSAKIAALTIQKELGAFSLTSATGYLEKSTHGIQDFSEQSEQYAEFLGGGPQAFPVGFDITSQYHQITEELRATSPNTGIWRWIAGVYFNDTKQNNPSHIVSSAFEPFGSSNFYYYDAPIQDRQFAVFGEGTFLPNEHVVLTAGLRAYQFREALQVYQGGLFGGPDVPLTHSTASGVDPKFTATFKANPNVNFYVSAAEGFRAGGPNPGVTTAITCTYIGAYKTSYSPDTVWNYEIGTKANLADDHLTINAAAFQLNWKDFQGTVNSSCGVFTANIGKARTRGVEIEPTARFNRYLSGYASFSYNDATVQEVGAAILTAGVGNPGDRLSYVPRVKYSVGGELTAPLAGQWHGYLRPEWQHVGEEATQFGVTNYASTMPAYNNLNLSAGVRNDVFDISLYAHNLTNSVQIINIEAPVLDGPVNLVNRPLTVGINFRYMQ